MTVIRKVKIDFQQIVWVEGKVVFRAGEFQHHLAVRWVLQLYFLPLHQTPSSLSVFFTGWIQIHIFVYL